MWKRLNNLWADRSGGEIIEYALVIGLVVGASLLVITAVGIKLLSYWSSIHVRM